MREVVDLCVDRLINNRSCCKVNIKRCVVRLATHRRDGRQLCKANIKITLQGNAFARQFVGWILAVDCFIIENTPSIADAGSQNTTNHAGGDWAVENRNGTAANFIKLVVIADQTERYVS